MRFQGLLSFTFIVSGALGLLSPGVAAQSASIQFLGGPSSASPIDLSPDGQWLVGQVGSESFRWSAGTGTQFFGGSSAWGVSADGSVMAGEVADGSGYLEAGIHETGSWSGKGNLGVLGCDPPFLSSFFSLADDGDTAVGMSWLGCTTSALKWTAAGGLSLLSKQAPTHSARANAVSGDGQLIGGWETADTGPRRGCLWLANGTQQFILESPTNVEGLGEIAHLSTDGSAACGKSGKMPFVWTSGGGVEVLPSPAGHPTSFTTNITANGMSDNGSVAAGVAATFPVLDAWMWTAQTGSVRIYDHLTAQGVTGITPSDIRNATSVSADGTKICGWGNSGGWIVTLAPAPSPWTDIGGGSVGINGQPTLVGGGSLTGGSTATLDLTQGPASAPCLAWLSFNPTPAPFFGGVVHTLPFSSQFLFATNPSGAINLSVTWPMGLPSGTNAWIQFLCQDNSVIYDITLSNAVKLTTP